MAQRLADWVSDHLPEVKTLTKRGVMPVSIITRWEMFVYYSGLTNKSKMEKYSITATHFKLRDSRTVMNAIKEMERTL